MKIEMPHMTSIYMCQYGLCERKMACVRSHYTGHIGLCTEKVFGNTGRGVKIKIHSHIMLCSKVHRTIVVSPMFGGDNIFLYTTHYLQ